jgi:glycosyltransferase involved in cell wall biosynthesis
MNKPDPINQLVVAGHPFIAIGMAEQVRACFRAFRAAGAEPKLRDVYGAPRTDPDYEREFGGAVTSRLSPVANVFNLNGDEVEQALAHLGDDHFTSAFNAIAPAWELPAYPAVWARQLERFTEVWAVSEFVRKSIAASTTMPVVHMPLAVDPILSEFHTRRSLGLPEHAFLFVFFFDFSSYLARKNPFAVLEAFNRLVERHPGAPLHLVMKHKGGKADGAEEARFREAMGKHSEQVQVIERRLSNAETRSLIRNADCFVSLHRSEGFGFGLAESMALGTPAIGTGYSGNMDFMNAENSWLVDFDMIPVNAGDYPHAEGQHWADPRVAHAVDLMEAVWRNGELARSRAERARRDMLRDFSARAIGLRYVDRLEEALRQRAA